MADPVPSFGKPPAAIMSAMAALDSKLAAPPPEAPAAAPSGAQPAQAVAEKDNSRPKRYYRNTRDDLVRHRQLVESRLDPIDCRDVLSSGRLTQGVVIHSKLLSVVYQDQLPGEKREIFRIVDSSDAGALERQFMLNMYPLAVGLKALNGAVLPARSADPKASFEDWLKLRVEYISAQVSGTWLDLLWHNYNWFLERCSEFTVEELGNG